MTEKVGRARECRLGPASLGEVTEWIEGYRRASEGRLDRFGRRPVWPDGFVACSDGVIDWLPPPATGSRTTATSAIASRSSCTDA